ncbi:hypothetical protein [Staphylococcus chromogenes]|uniref:hypothetical protein n=1 Tax=Staphylococcus chromogenes TaxID=46126 RepID=UPI000D1B7136|nr:hypothetical protein [Staphylococcus chromogenes]PTG23398.1 hypothetical protein BU642_04110 [Staphylococcus chromogenes]PTG95767.1 hypothetical protein BU632_07425 [Staphylococcus chromogenes]
MVKIKTKKEMNLPELIQWGWKNGEEQRIFRGSKYGSVCFNDDGWVIIETAIEQDETFEVEIEQEITEETVIFRLLEVRNAIPSNKTEWKDLKILKSYLYGNHSISEIKNEYSVAIYMLNDDMTMTLIWRNGGMVE